MKSTILLLNLTFLFCGILNAQQKNASSELQGKWVKMGHSGPVALEFKSNGTVEVDFGNDQTTDVVTGYETNGNRISFIDKEGAMCPEPGVYEFEKNDYYLSFDLVDDMCNGRIKMTMGYWTKPISEELTGELSEKISATENPKLYLSRARIYMALGKSDEAKADLDVYIEQNPGDSRALINRAGTRFPKDMEGALKDCNKAIALDPENKNAYFLRGLAHYELGSKEQACEDFSKAIDLGFSILRIAEEQRCAEFWND
jgi:tetratricopeptide (TPR) repeat protein